MLNFCFVVPKKTYTFFKKARTMSSFCKVCYFKRNASLYARKSNYSKYTKSLVFGKVDSFIFKNVTNLLKFKNIFGHKMSFVNIIETSGYVFSGLYVEGYKMISSHLNVIITSFKIFSTLFGVWYVCTDLVFNILPLGITIVLLFALSVYLLRIPSPDDLTINTIIGKDPACEESNDKLVKTVAHRGAGLDAPENSLIAFKMCNEKGIKFVEFDVTLTADNVPVVFHDDTLERMTDCAEYVHEKTYEELKKFDIAVKHPFSDRYRQTVIPTLEEAVTQLLNSGQNMFIDVKDNNMKMVSVICDLYEKYPELYLRSITTSFFPNIIYFIRRRNPKIVCSLAWRPYAFTHTSYSYSSGKGSKRSDVFYKHFLYIICDYLHESLLPMVTYYLLGISFILLHKDAICGRTVREWRDKGVRVIAWTVNHPLEKQHFARVLKVTYMTDTLIGETTTHSGGY